MKILFLDIDGVLNSTRSAVAFGGYPMNVEKPHMERFDHVAVALIKKICKDTGAKIVLSSVWRLYEGHMNMANALHLPIIDSTPEKLTALRGEEIAMWLRDHPEVEKYVIIDDDSDMLEDQMPYFVQTSHLNGFLYQDYLKALEILKPQQEKLK